MTMGLPKLGTGWAILKSIPTDETISRLSCRNGCTWTAYNNKCTSIIKNQRETMIQKIGSSCMFIGLWLSYIVPIHHFSATRSRNRCIIYFSITNKPWHLPRTDFSSGRVAARIHFLKILWSKYNTISCNKHYWRIALWAWQSKSICLWAFKELLPRIKSTHSNFVRKAVESHCGFFCPSISHRRHPLSELSQSTCAFFIGHVLSYILSVLGICYYT